MSTVHSSNWHPLFSAEDAGTITLSSQDAILFRVHLYTLRRASGWFAAMSGLPQGPGTVSDDVLHLDEDSTVLAPLLQMICAMELPDLSSMDLVESILLAAEKYDMPGPVSMIRNTITSYLSEPTALRLYRLAGARSWKAQAQLASSYTLSLDLSSWGDMFPHEPKNKPQQRFQSTDAQTSNYPNGDRRTLPHGRVSLSATIPTA